MRELYALDFWIRQMLRDTNSPARTLAIMKEALAENAVEMGYIEHADGSWRFAGWWTWGPGVQCVEQVPWSPWENREAS